MTMFFRCYLCLPLILAYIILILVVNGEDFAQLMSHYYSNVMLPGMQTSFNRSFNEESEVRANSYELELDGLNPERYIKARGFNAEKYHVTTKDGYILSIYRVVNPYADPKSTHLKPVILQHGLLMSCYDWMINSEDGFARVPSDPRQYNDTSIPFGNNLAFELSNLGYDVWLSNSRGNTLSTLHTKVNPLTDHRYWQFSIDQMAEYDSPAIIQFVQQKTGQQQLSWVGHSQGAGMMFALLAMSPEMNQVIKPFISVAGATRATNTRMTISLAIPGQFMAKIGADIVSAIGGPIPGQLRNPVTVAYIQQCARYPQLSCLTSFQAVGGYNHKELNMSRIGIYTAHMPSGTSLWTFNHFLQSKASMRFQKYDRGYQENLRKYRQAKPPRYALERITNPFIALIYSRGDSYATIEDTNWLKQQLKSIIDIKITGLLPLFLDYEVPDPEFDHMDFLIGFHAHKYVNLKIYETLARALWP